MLYTLYGTFYVPSYMEHTYFILYNILCPVARNSFSKLLKIEMLSNLSQNSHTSRKWQDPCSMLLVSMLLTIVLLRMDYRVSRE